MRWIFFLLILISCRPPSTTLFHGVAMTIPYHITIGNSLSHQSKEAIQRVITETFHEGNRIYNRWEPTSELSRLNAMMQDIELPISQELMALLRETDRFVAIDASFDPTVEPLYRCWAQHLEQKSVPAPQQLEELKQAIGWEKLLLQETSVIKKHPLTALDLGGIAKGYLVDLLITRIQNLGYEHILVEWGGELRACGMHPEQRAWQIAITQPLEVISPENLPTIISLCDQALATSGDYLQNWSLGDCQYTHLIDIATHQMKKMTSTSIASATVLADDCMTADALATILLMCTDCEMAKKKIELLQCTFPHTSYLVVAHDGSHFSTF